MDGIINDIFADIRMHNMGRPIVVYVGVGTAAGTYTMINGEKIVSPENYHQYPQVLRDMECIRGRMKKYIILIDPMLENPPHITQDQHNGFRFQRITDTYYSDPQNLVDLYVIRESITHNVYEQMWRHEGFTYITESLSKLIRLSKEHAINMIYHDFSGRQLLPLHDYHQKDIGVFHDRIVIGLGAQGDFGCYFDLTSPIASFAMKCDEIMGRQSLRICSPRHYLAHGRGLENAVKEYGEAFRPILSQQFGRISGDMRSEMIDRFFGNLRYIYNLRTKKSEELQTIKFEDLNKMFGELFAFNILERIKEQAYEHLFQEAIEHYGSKYDGLCIQAGLDFTGADLIRMITSNSKTIYDWATELRKFIN